MRFGYVIGQQLGHGTDPAAALREALAEARAAEEAGFDGVFVTEHHGTALRYMPGVTPLLFVLAKMTSRVQLGCAVLLLPLAQPARVAEEMALLDHVSGGRLLVGLGGGYLPVDFDYFGVEATRVGARVEEGVELIRKLWSQPQVSHEGRYYTCRGSVFPPPLTAGGPPLWLAGRSAAGVRRAARLGDTWVMDATPALPQFEKWYALYREEAAAHGRVPRTAVLRDAWLELGTPADADYRAAALRSHRAKLAGGVYSVDERLSGRDPESVSFDEFARDRWFCGTAADVDEQLGAWQRALDLDYALLRFRSDQVPGHDAVLEQIAAFGEAVIAPRHAVDTAAPIVDF